MLHKNTPIFCYVKVRESHDRKSTSTSGWHARLQPHWSVEEVHFKSRVQIVTSRSDKMK